MSVSEAPKSGMGVVHNTLMFEKPEKTVLRGPFRVRPLPAWFVTHSNAAAVAERATAFEHRPSLWKLPGLLAAAFRS